MTEKTKAEFLADNAQALADNQRISAETLRSEFEDMADSVGFLDALSPAATSGFLADLDTNVTGSDLDGMQSKLEDIEPSAAADQTGAEIVVLLDTELGGSGWQGGGGGGGGGLLNVVEDLTPQLGGNLDLNGNLVGGASQANLTKLTSMTASAAELNYVTGVTSGIQAQFAAMTIAKADSSHTHTAAATTSGTFNPARISEASVLQHETALTITESQISDLGDTYAATADLASTSNGDGAAMIGIEDSGGLISSETVEGALAENRTAIDALEAAGYVARVVHGATAATARPSVDFVEWVGSVEPTNAENDDTWVDTSA